jgi:uncharacterized protein YidB (DUF937 family)
MGLLDNLTKAAASNMGAEGQGSGLAGAILQMLQNQPGGIAGLMQNFQQNGLGNLLQSWIGTGQNLPISAEQVKQVLGHQQVAQIADQAGVSHEEASSGLASLLPQIVDKLTPNGQVPQSGDLMSQGMELLKGKLFG